ncbi:MAG: polyphosphate polymerase domain-containing protein [Candidatus Pelethousia sp.]|nr:polyphosphate polymerase domain-containing protein [Candidatus Pelethousia sp.]
MDKAGGRHEIKHYINRADQIELCSRLAHVAKPDENAAAGGGYRVRSLYFDNYEDKALREKIDGVNEREKFRLRYYNGDPSFLRLEKKSKAGGLCFKESAEVSAMACRALLFGDYGMLKESGEPLAWELYAKMHAQLLRPKSIVDYRRDAYVYPPGNVRITIDYDIRAGLVPKDFLNSEAPSIPVPGPAILEVKYDAFLPEVIRGIVSLSSRQTAAFSKYAAARII